jgi:hypothetical protein
VKQRTKTALSLIVVLPCLAIFIFAFLNSSNPKLQLTKPPTQQAIKSKLAKDNPTEVVKIKQSYVAATKPAAVKDKVTKSKGLTNTGPGNILVLFIVSSLTGTVVSYMYKLKFCR